ncbi:MAG: 30S ribosomal protein S20 [Planctomycetota bacterium]
MPHIESAKKRLRQNLVRREANKKLSSSMKTVIKRVLAAVSEKNADVAQKTLPVAMKRIDKAAKRNVIHKNTAARYKSKVSRAVRSLQAAR